MQNPERVRRLAIFSAAVLIAIGGCRDRSSSDREPGVTESTITIGTWAPLTGPAAAWGAVARGISVYMQMVNDQGGIHGRRIELIVKDDAYQPSRTVSAVKQMVERDNVFAVVGGVGTATGMAVKEYLVEHGVPWVGPSTGSHEWAFPPRKNIFALAPLYFEESAILTEYALQELGRERVGVLYLNDEGGKSALVGVELALEAAGFGAPVEAVSFEVMDTDLSSQILRLREARADAVVLWTPPKHAAMALGQAAKLGYHPQWLASYILSDQELMFELTEGRWEGVIYAAFGRSYLSDDPLINQYREAKTKFAPDEREGVFFYSGFYYAEPLVEALRRSGRELTRERLIGELESLDNFQGSGPPVNYGPGDRLGVNSVSLVRCTSATKFEALTDFRRSSISLTEAVERLQPR